MPDLASLRSASLLPAQSCNLIAAEPRGLRGSPLRLARPRRSMRYQDRDHHLVEKGATRSADEVLGKPRMAESAGDKQIDFVPFDPAQDLLADGQSEIQLIVDACGNPGPLQVQDDVVRRGEAGPIAVEGDDVHGFCRAEERQRVMQGTARLATSVPGDEYPRADLLGHRHDRNAEHRPAALDDQFLD